MFVFHLEKILTGFSLAKIQNWQWQKYRIQLPTLKYLCSRDKRYQEKILDGTVQTKNANKSVESRAKNGNEQKIDENWNFAHVYFLVTRYLVSMNIELFTER